MRIVFSLTLHPNLLYISSITFEYPMCFFLWYSFSNSSLKHNPTLHEEIFSLAANADKGDTYFYSFVCVSYLLQSYHSYYLQESICVVDL